jgi:cadmium resistance protein CadD (predicted permease)
MTTNEGTVDRVVRVIAGLVILSLAFIGPKTAWGYVGLIPIATGLLGYCPAYSLFGINTCPAKK